ncbi:hypothetical protein pb186bvf_017735 [Paramecium bursaria]
MNKLSTASVATSRSQQDYKLPGGNGHLPGSMRLHHLCMVASHNSGCAKQYGWIYAQQRVTIEQQFMNCGARHFKIPLHWYTPSKQCCCCCSSDKQPFIAIAHEGNGHSNCSVSVLCRGIRAPQRAEVLFSELGVLAATHPKEIMVLMIEDFLYNYTGESNGTQNYTKEKVIDEIDQLLESTGLKQRAFRWSDPRVIPKLEDLRHGQNVIIFTDVEDVAKNPKISNYIYYGYKYTAMTDWTQSALVYDNERHLAEGRGTYDKSGNIIEPLFLFNMNPEASLRFFPYCSFINSYSEVKKRYHYIKKLYNKRPNLISSDYLDQGNIRGFVDEINEDTVDELNIRDDIDFIESHYRKIE